MPIDRRWKRKSCLYTEETERWTNRKKEESEMEEGKTVDVFIRFLIHAFRTKFIYRMSGEQCVLRVRHGRRYRQCVADKRQRKVKFMLGYRLNSIRSRPKTLEKNRMPKEKGFFNGGMKWTRAHHSMLIKILFKIRRIRRQLRSCLNSVSRSPAASRANRIIENWYWKRKDLEFVVRL